MYLWAHGKQEMRLDLSQSDLPGVFFQGDCSVEDELQEERLQLDLCFFHYGGTVTVYSIIYSCMFLFCYVFLCLL